MRANTILALAFVLLAGSAGGEPNAYRIATGDLLDIQVWREPDLSGDHRVDEGGAIQHVLIGAVAVAERTPDDVAAELRERLERDYLREAHVVVRVAESARRRASVLGSVARPGVYPVHEHTRVLDLLFAAGGPSADASGVAALIRSGDARGAPGERIELDLGALVERGDLERNLAIAPGDALVVEARAGATGDSGERVRVVGEVMRPGLYEIGEAETLLDAVLVAGGLTEYAAGNRARLVRGEGEERREERVRLGDLLEGSQDAANPRLRGGDLIVVPESFF